MDVCLGHAFQPRVDGVTFGPLSGGIDGSVVKQIAKFVEWAVKTGILRVMCAGLSSLINNIVDYPFSEEEKFADFYGVTEKEFDELLNRECNASIAHLRDDVLRFYDGYMNRMDEEF